MRLLLRVREKSCGRVADKFGLRTWTINLRTWIFGFTCLVFKTTYIDRRIPLRESAFFFTRRTLFPPLDKRNTRDKAKGLYISSERHIGELGVRCLSTLHRGQDSWRQSQTTTASHHAPTEQSVPPYLQASPSPTPKTKRSPRSQTSLRL